MTAPLPDIIAGARPWSSAGSIPEWPRLRQDITLSEEAIASGASFTWRLHARGKPEVDPGDWTGIEAC